MFASPAVLKLLFPPPPNKLNCYNQCHSAPIINVSFPPIGAQAFLLNSPLSETMTRRRAKSITWERARNTEPSVFRNNIFQWQDKDNTHNECSFAFIDHILGSKDPCKASGEGKEAKREAVRTRLEHACTEQQAHLRNYHGEEATAKRHGFKKGQLCIFHQPYLSPETAKDQWSMLARLIPVQFSPVQFRIY